MIALILLRIGLLQSKFGNQVSSTLNIKIFESLLKIIYSDGQSDMYEANLIRRLAGLLYLDNKIREDSAKYLGI